jgi:outer membrane protein assembly factor BamB
VRLPLAVNSNPVGSGGELFFGAAYPGGGRLIDLDMTRDFFPVRWSLMFPNAAVSAAPAVLSEVVFCGAEDGRVAAVSVENREAAWSFGFFETAGPVYADLQIDDTGLYVASDDSKLYCINRTSGKVKWQYFAGVGLKAAPTVTKDLVFESVPDVGVVVLDKGPAVVDTKGPQFDRQPRWIAHNATQFLAEDSAYVYVATIDQRIAAMDKTTGKPAFTSKENGFTACAINNKDGLVFAATSDNHVIAVRPVPVAGTIGEIVRANGSELDATQIARVSN